MKITIEIPDELVQGVAAAINLKEIPDDHVYYDAMEKCKLDVPQWCKCQMIAESFVDQLEKWVKDKNNV